MHSIKAGVLSISFTMSRAPGNGVLFSFPDLCDAGNMHTIPFTILCFSHLSFLFGVMNKTVYPVTLNRILYLLIEVIHLYTIHYGVRYLST